MFTRRDAKQSPTWKFAGTVEVRDEYHVGFQHRGLGNLRSEVFDTLPVERNIGKRRSGHVLPEQIDMGLIFEVCFREALIKDVSIEWRAEANERLEAIIPRFWKWVKTHNVRPLPKDGINVKLHLRMIFNVDS